MRAFSILILAIVIISCGENSSEKQADYSKLSISMDTVLVDPGDEFFNLKYGLTFSTLDAEKKFLYHWNRDQFTLDIVNLDNLTLEDRVPFEKEGPDGVGPFVIWLQKIGADQIVVNGISEMGIWNLAAEKIKMYKLAGEKFEGDSLGEGETFNRSTQFSEDGNMVYGILSNWMADKTGFARLDYPNKNLKRFSLPAFDSFKDFTLSLKSNDMIMMMGPEQSVSKSKNGFIISNSAFNTLYEYSISTDSMSEIKYNSKLTENRKKGTYINEVESQEAFEEIQEKLFQEINFKAPHWDAINKRYLRLSYLDLPKTGTGEEAKKKSKVFLSIFDEDFNLLGESLVEDYQKVPGYHFVKDGKLWIFENVDDELGFIRLSIN